MATRSNRRSDNLHLAGYLSLTLGMPACVIGLATTGLIDIFGSMALAFLVFAGLLRIGAGATAVGVTVPGYQRESTVDYVQRTAFWFGCGFGSAGVYAIVISAAFVASLMPVAIAALVVGLILIAGAVAAEPLSQRIAAQRRSAAVIPFGEQRLGEQREAA